MDVFAFIPANLTGEEMMEDAMRYDRLVNGQPMLVTVTDEQEFVPFTKVGEMMVV